MQFSIRAALVAAATAGALAGIGSGTAQAQQGCVGFQDGMGQTQVGDYRVDHGAGPYWCMGDPLCGGFPDGMGEVTVGDFRHEFGEGPYICL